MFLTVVKDTGGLAAVLPVHEHLLKLGYDARLVASGVSRDALYLKGIAFEEAETPEDLLDRFGIPEVLITSMCTKGGLGRDLIPLLAGRSTRIVVQDQWGVLTEWADEAFCPDYVVVNDYVGAQLVHEAWPELPTTHIKELGYASLDALHRFDQETAWATVRDRFSVPETSEVLSFFGQFHPTEQAAAEVVIAARSLPRKERTLLVGMHPRFDQGDVTLLEEGARIRLALTHFPGRVVYLPTSPQERIPAEHVVAASDVVLSMFSTALTYAAALNKPAIAILYPGSPMKRRYDEERAGTDTELPLGTLGCVAVPNSPGDFERDLGDALRGALEPKLVTAQQTYLRTDGETAARIAEFIISVLP